MADLLYYGLDWLALLLRWTHLIVGIAWIGASFYFVWLDDHLQPPSSDLAKKGVSGELWAVHGGGFYNPQKYMQAPKNLPANLHWFYWEAYSTFLTGFALFALTYLMNPSGFLIDAKVANLTPTVAVILALGFLVVGWLVYDGICRLLGSRKNGDLLVAICQAVFVVVASVVACKLFAGRAAFLIIGAMLGTIMAANVFFWIIPGQRKILATMRSGGTPDPLHSAIAKQRSVHNTYFTLPVLFAMTSNHFVVLTGNSLNWLLLVMMIFAGALVRRYFVERHRGKPNPLWIAISVALVLVTAVIAAPKNFGGRSNSAELSLARDIRPILEERCVACHSGPASPKQIDLTDSATILSNAQIIYQQVFVLKAMPQNNATDMTDEERQKIAQWFDKGAKP
ncbi:MAG: urate hydroxylase PuuD [Candidatus Pacebacteria bacterium]|nr:urate hydroxylase PuuD [Candidatus Paceibacterota bacterium]